MTRYVTILLLLLVVVMSCMATLWLYRAPVAQRQLAWTDTGFNIDLNHADPATLCLLPGIGRGAFGPFLRQLPEPLAMGCKDSGAFAGLEEMVGGLGLAADLAPP